MPSEHATIPVPPGLAPGAVVAGRYRIDKVLGAGGMGVVLAADHLLLRHRVALKVMLPGGPIAEEATRRFEREARIAASLRGEHIARVLDAGQTDAGDPFIAMEYLAGTDLEAVVTSRGPLPAAEAAGYLLAVCEALAEAHALGIVHRDLKPANLFLTKRPDGTPLVKVLDFGISKQVGAARAAVDVSVTGAAVTMGSPAFMSPEQARSARDVDARSDVWSLGCVLYRLCTAEYPFRGSTPTEVLARVLTDPPAPLPPGLDLPPRLRAIIDRCLCKNRDQRWPDVALLAEALADLAPADARVHAQRARSLLDRNRRDVVATLPRADAPAAVARRASAGARVAIAVGVITAAAAAAFGLSQGPRSAHPPATASSAPPAEAPPVVPPDAGAVASPPVAAPPTAPPRLRTRLVPKRARDSDVFDLRQ